MDASDTKDEIDPLLLQILVCPVTKQPLTYDREAQELVSKAAGLTGNVPKLLRGAPV